MDFSNLFPNAAGEYLGSLASAITVAAVLVMIAWFKSKNVRWAALTLNILVGWVCLYILFYGLPTGAVTSVAWWWVYLLGFGSLVFFLIMDRRQRSRTDSLAPVPVGLVPTIQPTTKPIEFYDSRTEKSNSLRGNLIKELEDSSEVWIAMIAGAQIRESLSILDKFTKIIINDPDSEQMERIAMIQPQGEDFVGLAKAAIRICGEREREGKKAVLHLSDNFVLNVVISDPNHESRAWARVQTFLPYHHGDVSPSYVVHIKERPALFKIIKASFDKMYEAAKPLLPST